MSRRRSVRTSATKRASPCSGLQFVRFGDDITDREAKAYPFPKGCTLLCLGEIRNMPGHCAIVDTDSGKVHAGFHCEVFSALDRSET